LRAYFLTSEAIVVASRRLLLADVLTDLLQLETDAGYGVAPSPEMLACKVFRVWDEEVGLGFRGSKPKPPKYTNSFHIKGLIKSCMG
jgi:hypothetical protein